MPNNLNTQTAKLGFYFALFTTLLTLLVITLGAYTRLTDAGLGCPDWPLCYGQVLVPESAKDISAAARLFPHQIIEHKKAWIEMTHRYLASSLGLCILILAFLNYHFRYKEKQLFSPILPFVLIIMVIFQGLLGKWTVTLKLLPIIVMGHLIGGMTTLTMVWWLTLKYSQKFCNNLMLNERTLRKLRFLTALSLGALVIQIGLGAWTSANYAALVCPDFPLCTHPHGHKFSLPNIHTLKTAFDLFYAGAPHGSHALDHEARIVVHMMHRLGALITMLIISFLSFTLWANAKKSCRMLNFLIVFLLGTQLCLGLINILARLPLSIALAHNVVAALLVLALVTLSYKLNMQAKFTHE